MDSGVDPGVANWGVSFVDEKKKKTLMMNVDLRTWDGVKHKLLFEDLGPCIYEFCLSSRRLFEKTNRLCIELLPKEIRSKRGVKPTNPLVRDMMVMFAQTVHIMFPHIRVYYANPVSLRAFTGTNGGKSHSENKNLTFSKGKILPRASMDLAEETFHDELGVHADAVEATGCAMILRDHSERLITSRYHREGVVRDFKKVKFASEVIYPDWRPKGAVKTRAEREKTEDGVGTQASVPKSKRRKLVR